MTGSVLNLEPALTSLLGTAKGMPASAAELALADVGWQGWNLFAEDLPHPSLVLRAAAMEHNLRLMARYVDAAGVLLAPHGKTTMSPQLFERQLQAGSWAVTAATVQHVQVYRTFGVPRIVLANQVIGRPHLDYLAAELFHDEDFELYLWVDSPDGVRALTSASRDHRLRRPWIVLSEVGWTGGRGGVRDHTELMAVAQAVAASGGRVQLAGLAVYEGLLATAGLPASATASGPVSTELDMHQWLASVVTQAERLHDRGLLADGYLLSGGGSTSFDAVVSEFAKAGHGSRVLLRCGCYLIHDHGFCDALSPLGSLDHRFPQHGTLLPALELWTYVTSVPEPGLALLGAGRRDAPYDAGLPVPLYRVPVGSRHFEPLEAEVLGMNDQHAYLRHNGAVRTGDRIVLGISHPCTAFDKWTHVPFVDEERNVVGAVRTYF